MHITHEMNKKLERFVGHVILHSRQSPRLIVGNEVLKKVGDVSDATQDVSAVLTSPSTSPGKCARLRGMVIHGANVVERRRPPHLVAQLISPGCDGRQVALRFVGIGGREVQDGAHGRHNAGVEVYLGYGCCNFMS